MSTPRTLTSLPCYALRPPGTEIELQTRRLRLARRYAIYNVMMMCRNTRMRLCTRGWLQLFRSHGLIVIMYAREHKRRDELRGRREPVFLRTVYSCADTSHATVEIEVYVFIYVDIILLQRTGGGMLRSGCTYALYIYIYTCTSEKG